MLLWQLLGCYQGSLHAVEASVLDRLHPEPMSLISLRHGFRSQVSWSVNQPLAALIVNPGHVQDLSPSQHSLLAGTPPVANSCGRLVTDRAGQFLFHQQTGATTRAMANVKEIVGVVEFAVSGPLQETTRSMSHLDTSIQTTSKEKSCRAVEESFTLDLAQESNNRTYRPWRSLATKRQSYVGKEVRRKRGKVPSGFFPLSSSPHDVMEMGGG